MQISAERIELRLRTTFKLATGSSDTRQNVVVQIDSGRGEAPLPPYYKDNVDTVMAYVDQVRPKLKAFSEIGDYKTFLSTLPRNCPPALCAIDEALHDLAAAKKGVPLYEFLGLKAKGLPETSFTIAIDEPEKMAERAMKCGLPILKIKLGSQNDLECVKAIRQATKARLRCDANGGWSREQAAQIIPRLADYDIELIEQPLARDDFEGFKWLKKKVSVPLFADESLQTEKDIEKLSDGIDGVVVKLMKTGGIEEALQVIKAARVKGLQVMISCMIESSLGVTAAAHLGALADYLDLDGSLLISNDPFKGVQFKGAKLILPKRPGLGVKEV